MQTASLEKPIPVSAGNPLPSASTSFVINLSSSTTPVALTRPEHAGLKRFTFFVSRRREEGRERFRLHMGYFPSQEEAEKLLDIVREFYPGAWASPAPGQRLRAAGATTAAAAPTAPAATSATIATPAEPAPARSSPAAAAAAAAAAVAAATAATAPSPLIAAAATPPAPITQTRASVAAPLAAAPLAAAPLAAAPPVAAPEVGAALTLALVPDAGRQLLADGAEASASTGSAKDAGGKPAGGKPERTADGRATPETDAAALALTNVRAAIASLDDAPMVPPANVPELKAAIIPRLVRAEVPAAKVAEPAKTQDKVLNDAEALKVLEKGAAVSGKTEPACFAVQLMWSVQPIEMAKVPQLAIFSAYTLYAAEGNRNGRRWYGLRLGFFTDAVSAKQVAQYVRSEFSTVSIVPVTGRERERAKSAAPMRAAPAAAEAKGEAAEKAAADEFAFIDDKPAAPAPARSPGAPGKRAKLRSAAPKPPALQRKARKELSLEETLEILGADQLQMQVENSELNSASTSESGVRHLQLQQVKGKPSRLGRLMNRLSGLDKA
jgi:hypothetical protein